MNKSLPLLVGAILVAFGLRGAADDWPTYRHDNRRTGTTPEQIDAARLVSAWSWRSPQPPATAWTRPARWDAYAHIRGLQAMRDYDRAFQLIVAGKQVYFGSSVDDSVYALDTATGQARWSFTTDAPVRMPPTYADARIYFGSDDGHAYCVEANDGKLVWKSDPPATEPMILNNGRFIAPLPCRSGVLVDRGTAYFALSMLPWRDSYLCAVDASSGKPEGLGRYVRKLSNQTFEGALLAHQKQLIASRGRVSPLLLDRGDGRALGEFEGGGGSFVSLAKSGQLIHGPGNKTGWVTQSDLATRKPVRTDKGATSVLLTDARRLVINGDQVLALDANTNQQRWRAPLTGAYDGILAGSTLFVGSDEEVVAFAVESGKRLWNHAVEGRACGLVVAGGQLFVSTDRGVIHCFRPGVAVKTETAQVDAEPTTKPHPAAANALEDVSDRALESRWLFRTGMDERARRRGLPQPEITVGDLSGSLHARVQGDLQLRQAGGAEALELDGSTNSILITDDHRAAKLPSQEISITAWVRVDRPLKWGGIIGAIQDNGDFERGWILGYSNSKFSFALAGEQGNDRLTYLVGKTDFDPGKWYHVVGTYDGTKQQIFVNGTLEGSSTTQKGPIRYPEQAFYEMGAYHDKDENFRMQGMLHEVRVYSRVLTGAEVDQQHAAKRRLFPEPINLALGPYLQFVDRESARIRWRTTQPSPTRLTVKFGSDTREIAHDEPKTSHEVLVDALPRNRLGHYHVGTIIDGKAGSTPAFELDTHFNFTVAGSPQNAVKRPIEVKSQPTVRSLLVQSSVDRGICVLLGRSSPQMALELVRRGDLRVICVETDPVRVESARSVFRQQGVYGSRVAVHRVESLAALPFVGRFANLVIAEQPLRGADAVARMAEMYRIVRPAGGVVSLRMDERDTGAPDKVAAWLRARNISFEVTDDSRLTIRRGKLPGAGEWSHLYARADNSAFGGETLGGASQTNGFRVHWLGRPGPNAQPDRNGRKPSPLSTNGRLFVQGLHRLIGIDAYNGTVLWSLEIPPLERFNMPRDSSNWCADDDFLYVAVRDRCWQINAATGEVVKFHEPRRGDRSDWNYDWSYLAREGDVLLGSAVKAGTAFTDFWGNADAGWYDARSGAATYKVCSENMFALDARSGKRLWERSQGVVVNSTITAADDRVYFVESRNAKVKASSSRRVGMPELWQDQYLVALDLKTGYQLWEKPLDTQDGTVVFWMAHGEDKLVVTSSTDKKYFVYAFAAQTGDREWHQEFGWPEGKGDHGKAMARAAIVSGKVYVRPMVFDLADGKLRSERVPAGKCGTYAATSNSLIFRTSNVTLWDFSANKTSEWSRLRPGCWLSTIPAGGMLLSPEAGGGCSCGSWMETSIGFMPVEDE